ncbi:MAG: tRNA 2-thiouridine(34) synthase MnmA [Gammaproteobacteria bacterium]
MKVIIGLSGGVDSSVAALMLLEQGHEVEGLFMKNWEEDDDEEYCSAADDLADARSVADTLGIPLHAVNFSAEYWDRVFEYFLAEYRDGRTPNPDVLCNREIKFRAFLDHARTLGADAIATGHYARRRSTASHVDLVKGLDPAKDQSYFLYMLSQEQLGPALFPLGELEKTQVRERAAAAGFSNHAKKDSTGICFIGERRFKDFLARFLPAQPGEIQTPDGRVIGQHQGLMFYTLGQRRGLGIGGLREASDDPWYVAAKDLRANVLTAVQEHDHPLLMSRALRTAPPHWIRGDMPDYPLHCKAKIRYRQQEQPCRVTHDGGRSEDMGLRVDFDTPQWAVTPGQSVVFYQDDVCLGGAIIESPED